LEKRNCDCHAVIQIGEERNQSFGEMKLAGLIPLPSLFGCAATT
jgi:hypothetical protein